MPQDGPWVAALRGFMEKTAEAHGKTEVFDGLHLSTFRLQSTAPIRTGIGSSGSHCGQRSSDSQNFSKLYSPCHIPLYQTLWIVENLEGPEVCLYSREYPSTE